MRPGPKLRFTPSACHEKQHHSFYLQPLTLIVLPRSTIYELVELSFLGPNDSVAL